MNCHWKCYHLWPLTIPLKLSVSLSLTRMFRPQIRWAPVNMFETSIQLFIFTIFLDFSIYIKILLFVAVSVSKSLSLPRSHWLCAFAHNTQASLVTPVYMTSNRNGDGSNSDTFVFETYLRSTEHTNHWILLGVCLILNRDWIAPNKSDVKL